MHHKTRLILRYTNEKITRTPLYSWRSHSLSGQYLLLFAVTENKQQLIRSIGYGQTQNAWIYKGSNYIHKLVDTGKKKRTKCVKMYFN